MAEIRIPADDFQVGDVIRTEQGADVTVRRIIRDKAGRVVVNPGDADALDGWAWQHAAVIRNA